MTSAGQAEKDLVSELYRRIEYRRSNSISITPVFDWKSVEFWAAGSGTGTGTAGHHYCRPESSRTRSGNVGSSQEALLQANGHHRSSCEAHGFQPCLYEAKAEATAAESESSADDEKLGQLRFGVRYESTSRTLLVNVLAGRNLSPPDATGHDPLRSNPYVRVCLLPDRRGGQQTAVQRKTRNPTFDETLAFEVSSYVEVQKRTLQLKVCDLDNKGSRHRPIGHVLLPLTGVNLVKGSPAWKPLEPCEKEQQDLGDIFISLNYLPSAGRLNVDVIKAEQLPQTDLAGRSAPFIRVCLVMDNKPCKSKKTSCKKNTANPVFNEGFSFQVAPPALLSEASLVVTAMHSNGGLVKDAFVGRVVLGQFATGPEESAHWERVLKSHRSPVAQWHSLMSRQECDALSPASLLVP